MRYHFEKPENYSRMYGKIYICNHPVYSRCTLYLIGKKGLAVIQQRRIPETKSTYWTEIDPWLVDTLYLNEGFKKFFDDRAGECEDNLYPKHKNDPWTATGKQFAVPYVFKTCFSKEPTTINDMRETFSVKSALYLDMNEKLPDVSEYEKRLEKLESDYKKGKISDTTFEPEAAVLQEQINDGHNRQFVGKVGEFCPIKPGCGGGLLVREQNGKFYAATGTTGYRWLESEQFLKKADEDVEVIDPETGKTKKVAGAKLIRGNEDIIDRSFYDALVNDAIEAISKYGDYEWFVSDDPYIAKEKPLPDFMQCMFVLSYE